MNIIDCQNGSKNLTNVTKYGMGYFSFTNNNRTLEFGYKLESKIGQKGYLNATTGTWCLIKFETGTETDYTPDLGLRSISYLLGSKPGGSIRGFNPLFLGLSLLTVAVIYLMLKKKGTLL